MTCAGMTMRSVLRVNGTLVLRRAVVLRSRKTAVILMLVASGRGVAVLPDWVIREVKYKPDFVVRPVTETGLTKRLYAAIRNDDGDKPYMAHLLRLAREIPVRMQRREPVAG